jgi:chemotaxis protein methyltransferase CheR
MMVDTPGYEYIRTWLNQRCGISYPDKKKDLLRQRLGRVTARFGVVDLNELATQLKGDGSREIQLAVLHAASTNHTFFFREPQVLDVFRDRILPSLADREAIRIWSAAASSGDEAYTLAIVATETLGRTGIEDRVAVLGTDISEPMIARAESAIYGASHLEQTPDPILRRYFTPIGKEQYRVIDDLRRMCTFRRMNLKATPYPFRKPFHVVFCRNVLYYFDRDHQISTLESLYDVTAPGGWLLTSVTEAIRDLGTRWKVVSSGVYRKAP